MRLIHLRMFSKETRLKDMLFVRVLSPRCIRFIDQLG